VSAWPLVPPLDELQPSLVADDDQLRTTSSSTHSDDDNNDAQESQLYQSAYAESSNNNDDEDEEEDEFTTEKVLIPETKEDWNAAEAPSLAATPATPATSSSSTSSSSSGNSGSSSTHTQNTHNANMKAGGEVTTALLQEVFGMSLGRVYQGGTASMVEKLFNVTSTDRILYVGDHVFTDVSIAKVTHLLLTHR